MARAAAAVDRLRAGLPGSGASPARRSFGGALDPLRPYPPARHVPLPAPAAGLQQAAACRTATDQNGDPGPGPRQRLLVRQPLDCRLHPDPLRHVPPDSATLGPGRLGRLRLLRLAFAVLLGTAAVPGVYPGRDADPVGAGQPEDRRTRGPGRDARTRRRPRRRPPGCPADQRQGLRLEAVRAATGRRARHRTAAPITQARRRRFTTENRCSRRSAS